MAGQYEPFLINPPKRLRRRVKSRRYKRNDYQPGMETADPSEMGVGIRLGRASMKKRHGKTWKQTHKARLVRKEKVMAKRAKKAGTRRRKRKASPAQLRALARGRAKRLRNLRGKRRTTKKRYAKRKTTVSRKRYTKRAKVTTRRRRRAKLGRRHVIPVYLRKGVARTGPRRHKFGIKRNFRVNPFRRNPFGEELMVIGSNPVRRRRKRKYSANPKRKRGYKSMARGRRRFSRNPISSIGHLMPMIAAGTAGALATKMLPRVIGVTNTWAVYGTQAVVVVGGGYLADKFMGKSVSDGWIIGGATMVLSGLLGGVLGGVFAGLGLEYEAFPDEQLGAFPMGMLGDGGMGAYAEDNEFEPSMVY